jgi:protein-disulfide isomerase
MSDDESPQTPPADDDAPAEEAPRRRRKARPAATTRPAASTSSTAKAPARASVVATGAAPSQWTTGHVGAALALGLALGGMGGYLFGNKSAGPSATAESGKPGQSAAPAAANAKNQPSTAGAYVPLASWTPREGPEQAKVTIVEFSDFQ